MMLREGLREPHVASSEGGYGPRARECPFGTELDALLASRSPRFHKALEAGALDRLLFAEEMELIQVVTFRPSLTRQVVPFVPF